MVFPLPPPPPPPSSQVSVYALGRAYLKLSAALHINPPALGEPEWKSQSSSVGRGVVHSLGVTTWCSEGDIASFVATLHCFGSLTYIHNEARTAGTLFSLGSCVCCKCWTCVGLHSSVQEWTLYRSEASPPSNFGLYMCTRCIGFSRGFRSRTYMALEAAVISSQH